MMLKIATVVSLVCVFSIIQIAHCTSNDEIFRARIDSCPSCSLNRLPEVKKFIYDDVPKYDRVEFKRIHGAKPELVLLNEQEEELERIPLSDLSRKQCNDLLTSKGFSLKDDAKIEL